MVVTRVSNSQKMILFSLLGYTCLPLLSLINAHNLGEAIIHYLAIPTLIIASLISFYFIKKDFKNFHLLAKTILLIVSMNSIIGIVQYFDIGFHFLEGKKGAYGLMYNQNLYGTYTCMSLGFNFYLLINSRNYWKWFALFGMILSFVAIIISQTRSSYLSFSVILVVTCCYLLYFKSDYSKKFSVKKVLGVLMAGIIAFGIGVFSTDNTIKNRLHDTTLTLSSTDNTQNSISERFSLWGKTFVMIKDNALFGVGNGQWKIHINKYGTETLRTERGITVALRPHNDYLWVIAENGLLVGLIYILLLLFSIKYLFQQIIKKQDHLFSFCLLLCLIAFGLDSMFSFPKERIENLTILGVVFGGCLAIGNKEGSYFLKKSNQFLISILTIVQLIIFILLSIVNYSEFNFKMAVNAFYNIGDSQLAVNYANKINTNFYPFYYFNLKTVEQLKGGIYQSLGQYDNAEVAFKKATKINPYNAMVYADLGRFYSKKKEFIEAKNAFEKAIEVAPKYEEAYIGLANTYRTNEDYIKAHEVLNNSRLSTSKVHKVKSEFLKMIFNQGNQFARERNYTKAIQNFKYYITFDAKSEDAILNLAKCYYLIGEFRNGMHVLQNYSGQRNDILSLKKLMDEKI